MGQIFKSVQEIKKNYYCTYTNKKIKNIKPFYAWIKKNSFLQLMLKTSNTINIFIFVTYIYYILRVKKTTKNLLTVLIILRDISKSIKD